MQQIKKGIKCGVVLTMILPLAPALLLIIDMLQTTRRSYSDFESKSRVFHAVAQFAGCYGLPGGCDYNAPWFYGTFLTLWLVSCIILYRKAEKLFSSSSDRYKFIVAFSITFPVSLYIFAWGVRFLVFAVAVFKFGFV